MKTLFPIVGVETSDGLVLNGLLLEASKRKMITIHLHGDAGDFFHNAFYPRLSNVFLEHGISFLSASHRGAWIFQHSIEESVPHGVAGELFSDCVKDIDAWIAFALKKGYTEIILEGHSRGTEKIVYYMNNGKYVNTIRALILLGVGNAVGTQQEYEKKIGHTFMTEATTMVENDLGDHLLFDLRAFSGEYPITAKTYVDLMKKDSANTQATPFHKKELPFFSTIKTPILAVFGDQKEYTIIPVHEACELLEKENKNAEAHQIRNCDHCFRGKEKELAALVFDFMRRRIMV